LEKRKTGCGSHVYCVQFLGGLKTEEEDGVKKYVLTMK
jgi:hypothetical protein